MEPEATVHGALMFVFRLSRCMGCAPVRLLRTRNGHRLTLSYPMAYFGYACFIFFCSLLASGLAIDLYLYIRRNIEMEFSILKIVDMSICVMLNTIVYLNSTNRSKHMIKYLNIINEIRSTMIKDCDKRDTAEWKRIIIIISLILIYIIINLLSLTRYCINSTIRLADYFYSIVHLMYLTFYLLILQIILMVYEIHSVLETTKVKLVEIYQTNDTSWDLIRSKVRDLLKSYIVICILINKMNKRDGKTIFLTNAIFVIFIMFSVLALINCLKGNSETPIISICYNFLCFCIDIIRLVYIIEPFNLIIVESNKIKILLSKIMVKLTPVGAASAEWDLSCIQLCLTDPVFQPLGLFTLHRSLITKIINFITSYLIILIQYTRIQFYE